MTRINSAIAVCRLTDEHLLAEHREIKRLPYCLDKSIQSGSVNRIPSKFTLGTGHVLFFLNKMKFTFVRYKCLLSECVKRGMDVTDYSSNWSKIPALYFNNYVCTPEERNVLIERISQRIEQSSKSVWHYYGKPITKEQAIKLLTQ